MNSQYIDNMTSKKNADDPVAKPSISYGASTTDLSKPATLHQPGQPSWEIESSVNMMDYTLVDKKLDTLHLPPVYFRSVKPRDSPAFKMYTCRTCDASGNFAIIPMFVAIRPSSQGSQSATSNTTYVVSLMKYEALTKAYNRQDFSPSDYNWYVTQKTLFQQPNGGVFPTHYLLVKKTVDTSDSCPASVRASGKGKMPMPRAPAEIYGTTPQQPVIASGSGTQPTSEAMNKDSQNMAGSGSNTTSRPAAPSQKLAVNMGSIKSAFRKLTGDSTGPKAIGMKPLPGKRR